MAKKIKNRGESSADAATEQEEDGFDITTTRPDKPKMCVTALQFNETQTEFLSRIAAEKGTSRANFVRQCVVYGCKMLHKAGKIDEAFPI